MWIHAQPARLFPHGNMARDKFSRLPKWIALALRWPLAAAYWRTSVVAGFAARWLESRAGAATSWATACGLSCWAAASDPSPLARQPCIHCGEGKSQSRLAVRDGRHLSAGRALADCRASIRGSSPRAIPDGARLQAGQWLGGQRGAHHICQTPRPVFSDSAQTSDCRAYH